MLPKLCIFMGRIRRQSMHANKQRWAPFNFRLVNVRKARKAAISRNYWTVMGLEQSLIAYT
ncbi:Unannotated [Lentimonas sp. CC4]|nr:Unannotated [Lentimonas sp. CC4]CAA6685705.1 Unannotated [Lentimonas sp. CC6]CAA7077148.1 Unannotated [Lentimonas sp. CC4]CAA7168769.1 Unannotated [Lentimonas sp. CC21]CAA7180864.1 Unannotated [Lentimonas sp. CC8]